MPVKQQIIEVNSLEDAFQKIREIDESPRIAVGFYYIIKIKNTGFLLEVNGKLDRTQGRPCDTK